MASGSRVKVSKAEAETEQDKAWLERFERAIRSEFPEAKFPGEPGFKGLDDEDDDETRRC